MAAKLVPELDVSDLDASVAFYVEVLGFTVVFERPAERFAYLDLDGVSLMLEEAAGPGRRFRTAPLERPFGRGINFQAAVSNVDAVLERVCAAGCEPVIPLEERWYEVDVQVATGRWTPGGPMSAGNRQFVVADPDGYLWRFYQDLGMRANDQIKPWMPLDREPVIDFIVGIQRGEFHLAITAEDQPDLADVDGYYRSGGGEFWVAREGEAVIGTIAAIAIGDGQVALRKMFVSPDHRGAASGLASALIATLLGWAEARGVRTVYLGTTAAMAAAHRFYAKHGFDEIVPSELPPTFPVMAVDSRFYRRLLERHG